ncbi:hypothetical protein MNB_SM-4-1155 [hydrothermal vent metagenome]|uniref:Knr4/Smi1-like domain-containing protein n=1 Tax=hydrothermal vent metagenome TaxID=652676 RepID=A0A1W1CF93_9ZZZZ
MSINGNEIIKLIGLPESDDKVLDLFEDLGVNRPEIDEDDCMEDINLKEKYGLNLAFDDNILTEMQKNYSGGGFFLCNIVFYSSCNFLPFGLNENDDLETIQKKIEKKANYSDTEDELNIYWFYPDLGWFTVYFTDNNFNKIAAISLKTYEDPTDEEFDFLEPIK